MKVFFDKQNERTTWLAGYQCCITMYSFIAFGLIIVAAFQQTFIMDAVTYFPHIVRRPISMKTGT